MFDDDDDLQLWRNKSPCCNDTDNNKDQKVIKRTIITINAFKLSATASATMFDDDDYQSLAL